MDIRLIVSDMDRTLLREDKSVSPYTVSVLQACREKGILFAVATARPIRAMTEYLPLLEPDAVLYHNGAVIHQVGCAPVHCGISFPDAQRFLIEYHHAFPEAWISVEMNDHLYANFNAESLWPGVLFSKTDFSDLPITEADKIIVRASSHEDLLSIREWLSKELYVHLSEETVGMIMHEKATKQAGVAHLCNVFGIPPEQVISFGDDHNDVEMLRFCGMGVAVRNAIEEAIHAADDVCGSNEEDGPARWLKTRLLQSGN